MADLPVEGLQLSEQASKLRTAIKVSELNLRTEKLKLRMVELDIEKSKVQYEILNIEDEMKRLANPDQPAAAK